uniref:Uncharacterized protein n=1 Tax=Medicago truncatula TaxID=3880 RepID=A2Q3D4_MEDTR|nr:hypothetical protein MtrDRAFT_AC155881g16v1 [Medicago truncatula]
MDNAQGPTRFQLDKLSYLFLHDDLEVIPPCRLPEASTAQTIRKLSRIGSGRYVLKCLRNSENGNQTCIDKDNAKHGAFPKLHAHEKVDESNSTYSLAKKAKLPAFPMGKNARSGTLFYDNSEEKVLHIKYPNELGIRLESVKLNVTMLSVDGFYNFGNDTLCNVNGEESDIPDNDSVMSHD